MIHLFKPSKQEVTVCAICSLTVDEHKCCAPANGKNCGFVLIEKFMGMPFCAAHIEKEKELQAENEKRAKERVEATYERKEINQPDTSIEVVTDIFNAKIASIDSIRVEIENDASIENKHFELAHRLEERFLHFRQLIIESQQIIKDAQAETRTIQTYYNDLAKKLKQEEREKIKIQNVEYRPPEKPVKAIKAPTVKKYDKSAIRDASQKSGIPEALIQMTCVARQVTPIQAIAILKESGL